MRKIVCLVATPIAALLAAGIPENPPGNGPGPAQVLLAVGVPTLLSGVVVWRDGGSVASSAAWALASVAATGVVLLFLLLVVVLVIRPA